MSKIEGLGGSWEALGQLLEALGALLEAPGDSKSLGESTGQGTWALERPREPHGKGLYDENNSNNSLRSFHDPKLRQDFLNRY